LKPGNKWRGVKDCTSEQRGTVPFYSSRIFGGLPAWLEWLGCAIANSSCDERHPVKKCCAADSSCATWSFQLERETAERKSDPREMRTPREPEGRRYARWGSTQGDTKNRRGNRYRTDNLESQLIQYYTSWIRKGIRGTSATCGSYINTDHPVASTWRKIWKK
jgi:hypothetical protein